MNTKLLRFRWWLGRVLHQAVWSIETLGQNRVLFHNNWVPKKPNKLSWLARCYAAWQVISGRAAAVRWYRGNETSW